MGEVSGRQAELLPGLRVAIGVGTIAVALLYLASDLVELTQGGFSSAYTFVFSPGTVVYALVRDVCGLAGAAGTARRLADRARRPHGCDGGCFAVAVARAGVLPLWTGAALLVGLVFIAVASGMSDVARTLKWGLA